MMAGKKRILVLTCGGTIAMQIDPQLGAARHSDRPLDLYSIEPRLAEFAEIESRKIANIDSTDASTEIWENLIGEISSSYEQFDGFVITFGTNTLGYCSSALSFALAGIGKPVVITGAQVPASEIHSDGRLNLINSCLVACSEIAGVYVVFGSRIINGTRAKKVNERDYDSFQGFLGGVAGSIGVKVVLEPSAARRHDRPFTAKNGFCRDIASLTLFPDIEPGVFSALIDAGYRGLVIRAFGGGDIPRKLFPALKFAQERQVPIVVTTQAPFGRATMNLNEVGLEALEYGVIPAIDMSIESMTTKMMWLLGQKTPYQEFKRQMQTNLAGEIGAA